MHFKGRIIQGQQLGRKLGFPTANLEVDRESSCPDGVYLSRVRVQGKEYSALSNLGTNPTVGGQKRLLESHLLDYAGKELYGQTIEVELKQRLRGEVQFHSIEALGRQLRKDLLLAREILRKQEL